MKKLAILALAIVVAPALAVAIPGNFNGWDNTILMTEGPTGFFTYNATGVPGGRAQFVLLRNPGDWSDANKYTLSGDQAAYAPVSGELTITFDTNTYADDWYPTMNRVGVDYDVADWTAVGDWQGWNNADAATHMTDMGGGIYSFMATGLGVGDHWYKAVRTGTWDAIGANSYNQNADNLQFNIPDAAHSDVIFQVDAYHGTIRADVVPEPVSVVLLALGALIRRR